MGLLHEYLQCHVILRQGQQLKTELHERLQMIRSEEQDMEVEWTKVRWAAWCDGEVVELPRVCEASL